MADESLCAACNASMFPQANYCRSCGKALPRPAPVQPIPIAPYSPPQNQRSITAKTLPMPMPSPGAALPTPATTRIAPTPAIPKKRRGWLLAAHWVVWALVGAILFCIAFYRSDSSVNIHVGEAERQPSPPGFTAPAAPEVEEVYTIVLDGQRFRVNVIAKGYTWKEVSTTEITNIGNVLEKGINSFTPSLQDQIRQADEVLAMGTADFRHKDVELEADRASDRVNTIARSILIPLKGGNEEVVHTLNLGKWMGCENENPSYSDQRRIVIVQMWNRDPSKELKVELRKALEKMLKERDSSIIRQVLNCYAKSHNFSIG